MLFSEVLGAFNFLGAHIYEFLLLSILTLLIAAFAISYYRLKLHPISKFPGPKLWAISRIPYVYYTVRGTLHYRLAELHDEYGSVLRIAPAELSYTKEEVWSDAYFSHNGKQFARDPSNTPDAPEGGAHSIIMTLNEDDHARMRRVFAPSFSEAELRKQEQVICAYVDLLVQRFRDQAGEPIDFWQWLNYAVFDIVGDLTFGESFDCLESSKEHEWITNVFCFIKAITFLAMALKLSPLHKLLMLMVPKSLREREQAHLAQTKEKLARRLTDKHARPDFLSLAQATLNEPQGMSLAELRESSALLVLAGSETSATSLTGTFRLLLTNPSKLQTLIAEVRGAFHSEQDITIENVRARLPYQLAVINESLRLLTPVPVAFSLNRVVPDEGAVIAGEFVAGGTVVAVSPWAAFRSKANFADAEAFVPERWLEGEECPERYRDDKRKVVQAFGVGPRGCLGKVLAYAEMGLIVARILWSFDLDLVEKGKPWGFERGSKVWLVWEHDPLMVRVTPVKK